MTVFMIYIVEPCIYSGIKEMVYILDALLSKRSYNENDHCTVMYGFPLRQSRSFLSCSSDDKPPSI